MPSIIDIPIDVETIGIIIFFISLLLILYINRKKIVLQKILFPIIYILMLKTQIGLRLMDSIARRYKKSLKYIGYLGIIIGFIGMIFITFSLIHNIYTVITKPKALPGVGIVLPIQAKGIFYVPFFYWIISLFIIVVIHEFSHGVLIRYYGLKVKSSGFAILSLFVPIIPAAFVEPDEKKLIKSPVLEQLSIYSAGPFSNILLGFILILFTGYIASPMIDNYLINYDGVIITNLAKSNITKYPAERVGIKNGEIIKEIDTKSVTTISNFTEILSNKKPGDSILIKTTNSNYNLLLAENPDEKGKAYLGVYVTQSKSIKKNFTKKYGEASSKIILWFFGLLYWLSILNLGIGLFNLVPLGPIDGGRMLKSVLDKFLKKEQANKIFKWTGIFFLVIIIFSLVMSFFK